MAFLLFLIGFFAAVLGLAGVIYPKIIKRRTVTRKQYLLLLVAGFVAMVTGGVSGGSKQPTVAEPPAEVAASAPAEKNTVLFDLREIVLKPKEQVELFTGQPLQPCETGKYGLSCTYQTGETAIDVVYIKGVADWITIKNQNFKSFSVPQQLGFDYQKAATQTLDAITYQHAYGVQEMTVFLASGKVDYVYIKAQTH